MNTALLLLSGLAIREALRASREDGWIRHIGRWLLATVALGGMFVALQGWEWVRLLHHGITATTNQASGYFYLIVGAHAAHAVAGLLLLLVLTLWSRSVRLLQAATIYWTFVVLLWPILYVLVYLL
jgi:heme/copper-type cytochrome/quinol oxidase subunit 3